MSAQLAPLDAAKLADSVYLGLDSDDLTHFGRLARSQERLPGGFVPVGKLIRARTGTSRTSNFAVVMNREVPGAVHKVVAIRGTDMESNQDWLTNFNIGMVPGPGGWPCHAGFCFTYRSMVDEIRAGVGNRPCTVHVVGHSLGGALAALTALDLNARGHDAHLYTFGSPRVGPLAFTQHISRTLSGKLYRVYDHGDPVPMIPLFPFLHAPLTGDGYRVGVARDSISADYHAMRKNYVAMCCESSDWRALQQRYAGTQLAFGPAYWLEKAGERTRIPGASTGLWALGKALEAILKTIGVALQSVFSSALTVLDMVAWALDRAIEIGGQIKDWVMDWLRKALRWLGREVVAPAAEVTRVFLHYVLEMMMRHLANMARLALDAVGRRMA